MATVSTASTSAGPSRPRAATAGLWILQVLLAVMYVVPSGMPKLLGDPYAVQLFDELGAPWLRIVIGVAEVAGGIALLVPRLAGLAAACLVALMLGATGAQLFALDQGYWYTPVIFAVLLGVVAWARRADIAALVSRR